MLYFHQPTNPTIQQLLARKRNIYQFFYDSAFGRTHFHFLKSIFPIVFISTINFSSNPLGMEIIKKRYYTTPNR